MNSIVCTLFEGAYHYGVAALVNSLYKNGFIGDFYAGYRGELPPWAKEAQINPLLDYPLVHTYYVNGEIRVHFIPITTNYHFTNYKPDFILQLLEGPALNSDAVFYFDPDIVLVAPWSYFEDWVNCGVAVCEDIKSPLEKFHPKRMGWRKYYKEYGIELKYKNSIYVNGGFVGILSTNKYFIETWQLMQLHMSDYIGGLNRSSITDLTKLPEEISVNYSPFGATDQDALNATIEACNVEVSYMRKEAMALGVGGPILMPHALGQPKPWKFRPFRMFFQGKPPRFVDKIFWKNVKYPIKAYTHTKLVSMEFSLLVTSFLSRFYSRNEY